MPASGFKFYSSQHNGGVYMPSFSNKKSSNGGNKARPSNFVVFSVATYGTEDHKSGVRALAALLDYEGKAMCDAAIYGGEDAADNLRARDGDQFNVAGKLGMVTLDGDDGNPIECPSVFATDVQDMKKSKNKGGLQVSDLAILTVRVTKNGGGTAPSGNTPAKARTSLFLSKGKEQNRYMWLDVVAFPREGNEDVVAAVAGMEAGKSYTVKGSFRVNKYKDRYQFAVHPNSIDEFVWPERDDEIPEDDDIPM
jgi:hypothetical protein